MSFSDRVTNAVAAKAKLPPTLPALLYQAVLTEIRWPSPDDEMKSYSKDGKDVEYFMCSIKAQLVAPIGEVDEELEEVLAAELPRMQTFDVMITEDNIDTTGLLPLQSLVYDALALGNIEEDAENEVSVHTYFEKCLNQEVGLETRHRPWTAQDGTKRQSLELRQFHAL